MEKNGYLSPAQARQAWHTAITQARRTNLCPRNRVRYSETTVHNFDGKLGTSQTVGNTTVHNLGNKLGTSHTVGTTTMHNFYGKFGWSQRFGNIVVHSGALFTDR